MERVVRPTRTKCLLAELLAGDRYGHTQLIIVNLNATEIDAPVMTSDKKEVAEQTRRTFVELARHDFKLRRPWKSISTNNATLVLRHARIGITWSSNRTRLFFLDLYSCSLNDCLNSQFAMVRQGPWYFYRRRGVLFLDGQSSLKLTTT